MVVPWENLATPQAVRKALSRRVAPQSGPHCVSRLGIVATATTCIGFLVIIPIGAVTRPMDSFPEHPWSLMAIAAMHAGNSGFGLPGLVGGVGRVGGEQQEEDAADLVQKLKRHFLQDGAPGPHTQGRGAG